MARIVHITSAHHYLDSRIFYKECRAAAEAGHDVVLIAPGAKAGVISGVRVESVEKSYGRLRRMTVTLFRLWRKAIGEKADIYHFHDPELIVVGLLLKIRGKCVVYDVHEHLPNQILGKSYLRPKAIRAVLASVARMAEALVARVFDGFCAAAPSIADRFPEQKTILLRNFVELRLVDSIDAAAVEGVNNRKVVIYPGSLSKARGIGNVIDAVGRLDGRVELWLFGRWHDPVFEAACRRSKGWEYTRYFGRQSQESVIAHVKAADMGIHLPLVAPNYSDGLAVKGFEFMACRKPFLTTDEPGKRRTFHGCAVFADAADVDAIAAQIANTITDSKLRTLLGNTGRKRVEDEYSWEHESLRLLELYDCLKAERRCPGTPEAPGDTIQ